MKYSFLLVSFLVFNSFAQKYDGLVEPNKIAKIGLNPNYQFKKMIFDDSLKVVKIYTFNYLLGSSYSGAPKTFSEQQKEFEGKMPKEYKSLTYETLFPYISTIVLNDSLKLKIVDQALVSNKPIKGQNYLRVSPDLKKELKKGYPENLVIKDSVSSYFKRSKDISLVDNLKYRLVRDYPYSVRGEKGDIYLQKSWTTYTCDGVGGFLDEAHSEIINKPEFLAKLTGFVLAESMSDMGVRSQHQYVCKDGSIIQMIVRYQPKYKGGNRNIVYKNINFMHYNNNGKIIDTTDSEETFDIRFNKKIEVFSKTGEPKGVVFLGFHKAFEGFRKNTIPEDNVNVCYYFDENGKLVFKSKLKSTVDSVTKEAYYFRPVFALREDDKLVFLNVSNFDFAKKQIYEKYILDLNGVKLSTEFYDPHKYETYSRQGVFNLKTEKVESHKGKLYIFGREFHDSLNNPTDESTWHLDAFYLTIINPIDLTVEYRKRLLNFSSNPIGFKGFSNFEILSKNEDKKYLIFNWLNYENYIYDFDNIDNPMKLADSSKIPPFMGTGLNYVIDKENMKGYFLFTYDDKVFIRRVAF